jgi:hypothetical protein
MLRRRSTASARCAQRASASGTTAAWRLRGVPKGKLRRQFARGAAVKMLCPWSSSGSTQLRSSVGTLCPAGAAENDAATPRLRGASEGQLRRQLARGAAEETLCPWGSNRSTQPRCSVGTLSGGRQRRMQQRRGGCTACPGATVLRPAGLGGRCSDLAAPRVAALPAGPAACGDLGRVGLPTPLLAFAAVIEK